MRDVPTLSRLGFLWELIMSRYVVVLAALYGANAPSLADITTVFADDEWQSIDTPQSWIA
jgi:hypothetical protein